MGSTLKRSARFSRNIRRLASLIAAIITSSCGSDVVRGQYSLAPAFWKSTEHACIERDLAVEEVDLGVLLWAHYAQDLGVRRSDILLAMSNRVYVCILPYPFDCGGTETIGCAGAMEMLVSSRYRDGAPTNVAHIVSHELAHIIAIEMFLPTSNAHSEPIHVNVEPLVVADRLSIKW